MSDEDADGSPHGFWRRFRHSLLVAGTGVEQQKTVARPEVAWTPRTQRISRDSTMRDTPASGPRIPISRAPADALNRLQRSEERNPRRAGSAHASGNQRTLGDACATVTIARKAPPDGVFCCGSTTFTGRGRKGQTFFYVERERYGKMPTHKDRRVLGVCTKRSAWRTNAILRAMYDLSSSSGSQ